MLNISFADIVICIEAILGLGTITSFTEVSVNSKTLFISSCSVWSKTPLSLPSRMMSIISSSDIKGSAETLFLPKGSRKIFVDDVRNLIR